LPEISLTDFVDFVIKAGSPKLTKVREITTRGGYSPAFDYWKTLREHIADSHRGKVKLGASLEALHPKKRRPYDAALLGYGKFTRKVGPSPFFEPPSERWTSAGLVVRVNPELGLCIDGKRHVIKLYFKDEEPTKHRLHAVLELMRISLRKGRFADVSVAVLDVGAGKLITPTKEDPGFSLLLEAEALAFMTMWNAMTKEAGTLAKRASA
jgi:hypothetical protein